MWNFIFGFLFADASKKSRGFRLLLLLLIAGCAIAGVIYAVAVFNAVRSTPENHHVQHQPAR